MLHPSRRILDAHQKLLVDVEREGENPGVTGACLEGPKEIEDARGDFCFWRREVGLAMLLNPELILSWIKSRDPHGGVAIGRWKAAGAMQPAS
jgi:hypothetical protein